MPSPLHRRQSATVPLTLEKSQDPLPADRQGQRLYEIFGRYLWCSIYADAPENTSKKPKWYTQRRYPLKSRVLWREWQDAARLIGVRPGHDTVYALIDIDINSPYHPNQDANAITRMQAALETIGITRTILIRSSWSGGIHLYIPLPLLVKTFDLAVSLQNCLKAQGFKLRPGDLEIFPNVKTYGTTQKIEYLAHRLPLQPGSGSCLLDGEFNPGSSQLSNFLAQWNIAAAGQDIATLQSALPIARKNRRKKVHKRLNKAEAWKADLETLLAEGWTGSGQTNQLLKEFGCYGVVFLELSGEDLISYIHQQAISSPGYKKWCRHQREIEMRSRVWAAAVENYYWPLGSYSDIRQKAKNDIVPFNELRAQQAQANIRAAVQQLEAIDLPAAATARAQAIRAAQMDSGVSSSSLETLYKIGNKKLWHPDYDESRQEELPVIVAAAEDLASEAEDKEKALETPKPCEIRELRTKGKIMKCAPYKAEDSSSAQTKLNSEGGVRGDGKSFPQTQERNLEDRKDKLGDREPIRNNSQELNRQDSKKTLHPTESSQTMESVRSKIRSLELDYRQITKIIGQKFDGKRSYELSEEEKLLLLYHLNTLSQDKG